MSDLDLTTAREICMEFLDLQRVSLAEHRIRGEQLDVATGTFVDSARKYGMTWDDIGHSLGTTGTAARKAHTRRSRSDPVSEVAPEPVRARHDNCPECVSPSTFPTAAHSDGGTASTVTYRCNGCGHAWTTAWAS